MKEHLKNTIFSVLASALVLAEIGVLYATQLHDWQLYVLAAVQLGVIIFNYFRTFPSGWAFFLSVIWMVKAITLWPQPSGVERVWLFDDFAGALVCAINFLLSGWIYIFNRRRW